MSPHTFLIIGFACALIAIVGGVWWWLSIRDALFSDTDTVLIRFPNGSINAEVAASVLKHSAGLSARESLDADHGMLFVFPKPQSLTFWMKGMRFPLDFIWIRNNVVVDISPHIQPPHNVFDFSIVRPKELANMALEVNAGTVKRLGIKIGDPVEITKNQ